MESNSTSDEKLPLCDSGSLMFQDEEHSDNSLETVDDEEGTRRCACLFRRDLIPVRVFYLMFNAGLGMIVPYTPVFLKELGLSAFRIGLAVGIRQLIGSVSGVVFGYVADRFRFRRQILFFCLIGLLGFNLGLYLMPYPTRSINNKESSKASDNGTNWSFSMNTTQKAYTYDDQTKFNTCYLSNQSGIDSDSEEQPSGEDISWIYEASSLQRTFIIAFFLGCACEICQSPSFALLDAVTLQIVGKDGIALFGGQQAIGTSGWSISSLIMGAILSQTRVTESLCGVLLSFSNYRLIAYIFPFFTIIVLVSILFMSSKSESSVAEKTSDEQTLPVSDACSGVKLFLSIHYGSWLMTAFIVGLCNGLVWGFLNWHLSNLGGTELVMGINGIIDGFVGFTSFIWMSYFVEWIGHHSAMYIALLMYIIRFIIYAVIVNPWMVLFDSVLRGISYAMVWISLTAYITCNISHDSLATVQGVLHAVFISLGSGVGHVIGGILVESFGAVYTFWGTTVFITVWLVLFYITQKISRRYENENTDAQVINYTGKDDEDIALTSKTSSLE